MKLHRVRSNVTINSCKSSIEKWEDRSYNFVYSTRSRKLFQKWLDSNSYHLFIHLFINSEAYIYANTYSQQAENILQSADHAKVKAHVSKAVRGLKLTRRFSG